MLCEAAWVAVRTPGPVCAFYERVRARRGAQIALVATARKLSVLFWHLLTHEQDYAFGRPSLTRRKLRALELKVDMWSCPVFVDTGGLDGNGRPVLGVDHYLFVGVLVLEPFGGEVAERRVTSVGVVEAFD